MNIRRQFLSGPLRNDHLTYIVHQMKIYQIDIKQCARFIFENAIYYHSAATYYALLSKAISSMCYSITTSRGCNTFMYHLLNICREEYNSHFRNRTLYRLNEINKKKLLNTNIDTHLIAVMDKRLTDLKRRANGVANFYGELFKLRLISNTTFWDFINDLMGPTANCEFCIDFVCHFLLSADGNFESLVEFERLILILIYFKYMLCKFEDGFPSKVWPTVRKVIESKKRWMSKTAKISLKMKVVLAPKVIFQDIDLSDIDIDDRVYEIIKRTNLHTIDQTSEHVNNFIFLNPISFYEIVDYIIEKGIRNSNTNNIFAQLCAKVSNLTSQYLDRSFKDLIAARLQKQFSSHVCNLFDSSKDFNKQNNIKKQLKGTVQFIGALFNVNLLGYTIVLRIIKALLDTNTISEVSIECLSHFMSTIGGEGDNEKKFKQSILQLRTIIKKDETKFPLDIQCSLFNLLESLKSLDKSENTSFLEQTSSVKFKKK